MLRSDSSCSEENKEDDENERRGQRPVLKGCIKLNDFEVLAYDEDVYDFSPE